MARLQILELPEGPDDTRPPFVLVVDESAPQRVIIGMDHGRVRDHWQDAADQIGARGAIVTAETVEIPANDVSVEFREGLQEHLGEMYETARRSLSETETLGHKLLQRAENAEGRSRAMEVQRDRARLAAEAKLQAFAEEQQREFANRMDEITEALGLDRLRDWDEIVSAAKRVRDGGHLFGEPGHLDPQRCAACGVDRGAWLSGRDRRTCREIAVRGL